MPWREHSLSLGPLNLGAVNAPNEVMSVQDGGGAVADTNPREDHLARAMEEAEMISPRSHALLEDMMLDSVQAYFGGKLVAVQHTLFAIGCDVGEPSEAANDGHVSPNLKRKREDTHRTHRNDTPHEGHASPVARARPARVTTTDDEVEAYEASDEEKASPTSTCAFPRYRDRLARKLHRDFDQSDLRRARACLGKPVQLRRQALEMNFALILESACAKLATLAYRWTPKTCHKREEGAKSWEPIPAFEWEKSEPAATVSS
jgi:hypothetical protein